MIYVEYDHEYVQCHRIACVVSISKFFRINCQILTIIKLLQLKKFLPYFFYSIIFIMSRKPKSKSTRWNFKTKKLLNSSYVPYVREIIKGSISLQEATFEGFIRENPSFGIRTVAVLSAKIMTFCCKF